MKRSNNPAGINPGRTRREALALLGGGAALLGAAAAQRPAFAQGSDDVLTANPLALIPFRPPN